MRSSRLALGFGLLALAAVLGCAHSGPEARDDRQPEAQGETPGSQHRRSPDAARTRLAWPLHGRISSGFGNQRSSYRHRGIDIRTESGRPVRAAAEGRVSYSGNMRGYGRIVILDHGDGLETRYAHNRRNFVREGQRVERGQTIAEVGETGNATAPHVHFEVREQGEARDPLGFLPAPLPAASRPR